MNVTETCFCGAKFDARGESYELEPMWKDWRDRHATCHVPPSLPDLLAEAAATTDAGGVRLTPLGDPL